MNELRLKVVDQSIEIVRRRIDELGTKEPVIQRQGTDRIVVQLPGLQNPEYVKTLLGKTAKLSFHMVDSRSTAADARRGKLGSSSRLIKGEGGETYVISRKPVVGGENLVDAQAAFQEGQPVVSFKFNTIGGKKFGEATKNNIGERLAIVLDNEVISAPVVQSAITGGSGIISGNFTLESANDLALLLRSGALPAPLEVLEERTVGAGLGSDSIREGITASIIGLIAVIVFMVLAYGLFGIFTTVTVLMNLFLMLGALSFMGATLTLPGIAGIILGIGMGVDANVITAERIKEELSKNKTLEGAVNSGFKMGLTPIIDGNVTIVIVAAILMGAFGPTDGFWAKVFNPIFYWFGPSTAGTIYSFGFTLLTSVTPSENPGNGVFLSCFDENAKNYRGLLIRQLDNAQINIVFGQNVGVTVPGEFDREMHLAIVKDGASYRIYADGQLVAEAESPADSYDGTLLIGAQRDADGNIFRISQTQVNHLSVYAGVMAEADIAAYDFADAPLPPELVAESAAYTMPGAFVGNGSDRALDTGVKLYDVATKDWTLDTVIDVRKGVNNGVYMSCFSEETGHYRGFMLRQDNADTLTAYVGNSVGVTVDLPQGTSLMHLVVVKSGSQYTIWQDGELVQRVESACDNYDATLLLGAQRDADGNLFRFSNAGIRTLNITDGALSDTDAAALSAPVKDNSRF